MKLVLNWHQTIICELGNWIHFRSELYIIESIILVFDNTNKLIERVSKACWRSNMTPMVNQIFVVSGVPLVQTVAGPENPPVSPVVARNSKNTICLVKWIFIEEHFVCQGQDTSCDSLVLRISILFYELKSGEYFRTIEFPFLTLRLIKHK